MIPDPDLPLTFDPAFGKLGRSIARFANHTRRHVASSRKYRAALVQAHEWSGGLAPLDHTPDTPRVAFEALDRFAVAHRESRTHLLGAYFAHHYLRTQAEMSQELLRESFRTDPGHRVRTCWRVYRGQERIRKAWISSLLEFTLRVACPELDPDAYVALNTGSLTDHEDVDLAIVVSDERARTALSRGFGTVSRSFVRFASKIQLFLTEELKTPRICALVEEYAELKRRPNRSVVSVMQLLGAQYLCGSRALFQSLQEEVTGAYYAGGGEPLVHEGFLRSVMAELRYFLVPSTIPGVLAPKREVYVPAKLATGAMRVVHGVMEPLPPLALEEVAERDGARKDVYISLANSLVQVEVFRALAFLYVFNGDELNLKDSAARKASERVALLLGLGESARRTSADRLIGAYTDLRTRALAAVATLSTEIHRHLGRVSTFRRIVERGKRLEAGPADNLAENLLLALEEHEGGVFWDEVVELISRQPETGHRFVADLAALGRDRRVDLAGRYVRMMCEDAPSMVDFLVFLSDKDRDLDPVRAGKVGPNARLFWNQMVAHLAAGGPALEGFCQRLDAETTSEALHRLATAFPSYHLARLADLIEARDPTPRGTRVTRALRSVILLVHHRSNAVGRIASRVMARTPEFLQRLGDGRRLKDLATEILHRAAVEHRPDEQVRLLADASDVATLRSVVSGVLKGAPATQDTEQVAAVDQFVRELFKAHFREVRQRSPLFEHYRPGAQIAVFATGGYGRGEAFGSDFDYFAVVAEDDPRLGKFFGKVLQRVSATMARCGLQPHNRFADLFNAYAVGLPTLEAHLRRRSADCFIDEAEVLEGRFIVGDPAVARRFEDDIRGLVLGDNRLGFLKDVLHEIEDRRRFPPLGLSVKRGAGGLREIHLLWLALRCFAQLDHPFGPADVRVVTERLGRSGGELRFLMVAHDELRRARDLYRLTVAFEDVMEPELMVDVAMDLSPLAQVGIRGDYGHQLAKLMEATRIRVDRVASAIEDALGRER